MIAEPDISAREIFRAALRAADPFESVSQHANMINELFASGGYQGLSYLSFGKAAPRMAQAIESSVGDLLKEGIVITNHGNADGFGSRLHTPACVYEGGHPVPNRAGMNATGKAIEMVSALGEGDLLACLVSGGGSALLTAPAKGISLEDKQAVTNALLRSGADIGEVNTVRKHISAIKGGQLAALAYPAGIISLIVSDVVGDDVGTIASGPTAPDPSTFSDALSVLERYSIALPDNVRAHIEAGISGNKPETPKAQDKVFLRTRNVLVATNSKALDAAFNRALELGLSPRIITNELDGDVSDAARLLAEKAQEHRALPACLISGGEVTVHVTGSGTGGRNTELALRFALAIEGTKGITFLSAGTDGMDGMGEAAGAIVDGKTARKARKKGINPEAYLENNDSYNFFKKAGGLVVTGQTGTNVMDVQVMVLT